VRGAYKRENGVDNSTLEATFSFGGRKESADILTSKELEP